MHPDFDGSQLSRSFETRFVAGRALTFIPSFGTIAFAVARHRNAWFLPIVLQLFAGLLFISWLAWRRAKIERSSFETDAKEDAAWLRDQHIDKAKNDVLPACVGGLLACAIMSVLKRDPRWFVLGLLLSALIVFGLVLRWLVYDRWLGRTLSELSPA